MANSSLVERTKTFIEKHGVPATFKIRSNYVYDVAEGEATYDTDNLVAKVTPPAPYKEQFKGNTTLQVGDIVSFASATSFPDGKPSLGTIVVVDNLEFSIVKSEQYEYRGSVILYGFALNR